MVQRLHDIIVSEHLPEAARADRRRRIAHARRRCRRSTCSEIFGLMEIVRDRGGKVDVFTLDR